MSVWEVGVILLPHVRTRCEQGVSVTQWQGSGRVGGGLIKVLSKHTEWEGRTLRGEKSREVLRGSVAAVPGHTLGPTPGRGHEDVPVQSTTPGAQCPPLAA